MDFLSLIFSFAIIIPSAILHEYMHGWVANQLGDPTAKYAGRLTLDPRAHVDLWGSILLPLFLFIATAGRFLFAYAKPVPHNPYNLKNQRWGPVAVAVAGPLSNLALAFVFGLFVRFSILPFAASLFAIIVYVNVMLAVFNMVPIPPLDGSKLLYALLPDRLEGLKMTLERSGFLLLLLFVFFFFGLIRPVIDWVSWIFLGGY